MTVSRCGGRGDEVRIARLVGGVRRSFVTPLGYAGGNERIVQRWKREMGEVDEQQSRCVRRSTADLLLSDRTRHGWIHRAR